MKLTDLLSERDNTTLCVVRVLLTSGALAMLYNFIANQSHDYQGFAFGLASIGAAISMKNISEKS